MANQPKRLPYELPYGAEAKWPALPPPDAVARDEKTVIAANAARPAHNTPTPKRRIGAALGWNVCSGMVPAACPVAGSTCTPRFRTIFLATLTDCVAPGGSCASRSPSINDNSGPLFQESVTGLPVVRSGSCSRGVTSDR
jgi:hypothetical protein